MKIPLLVVIVLIFFVLITGCTTKPSSPGNPVTVPQPSPSVTPVPTSSPASGTTLSAATTNPAPLTLTSVFSGSPGLTTLISVSGKTGQTSDTFHVTGGYWEIWYTADPITTGGQDSVSGSGSNSAVFPLLQIQVIDKNSDRLVATVEPPGGLDKTLWQKSGIDPRPWKQKFYEGNKEYYFVITAKHLNSYTIEARVPGST
jgi:hypothetical protein